MPPYMFIALVVGGLGFLRLLDSGKKEAPPPVTKPTPPTKQEDDVTRGELRRVMSYLGKRSGQARSGKL